MLPTPSVQLFEDALGKIVPFVFKVSLRFEYGVKRDEYRVVVCYTFSQPKPLSTPTPPRPPDLTMDLLFSIFQNPIYLLLSWKPCLSRAVSLCVKDSLQLEPWCRNNRTRQLFDYLGE